MTNSQLDWCKYEWPKDCERVDGETDLQNSGAHCCIRKSVEDGERCAWHVELGKSSVNTKMKAALDNDQMDDETAIQKSDVDEVLDGAIMDGIDLRNNVSFEGASLRGASFRNADLRYANFEDADLRNANLRNANLAHADLANTNLSDADMAYVNLIQANLRKSNMENSNIYSAELKKSYMRYSNLSNTNLFGADLSEATLSRAVINNSNLRNADLKQATLGDVDLSESSLTNTNIENANIPNADLTDTEFDGAVLRDANLYRTDLTGASMSKTNIKYAFASRANFKGVNLSGSDLTKANLTHANLEECNLFGVDLSEANLEEATLADANLNKANLNHVGIAQTDLGGIKIDETTVMRPPSKWEIESDRAAKIESFNIRGFRWLRIIQRWGSELELLNKAEIQYRRLQRLRRKKDLKSDPSLSVYEKHAERKGALAERRLVKWFSLAINRRILGYGERIRPVITTSLTLIILFALFYPVFGIADGTLDPANNKSVIISYDSGYNLLSILGRSLYFSAVTFSNLGYADIYPKGWSRGFATAESFIGALLMAYLVFVLGRRVTR